MDKKKENLYKMNYSNNKDNLRQEIPFQNMLISPNNIFQFRPIPNIVFVDTNFLNKKRESKELSQNDILDSEDKSKFFNKCSRCLKTIPNNEIFKCQACYKVFHRKCLTEQEYTLHSLNNIFQCSECRIKLASLFAMNYNTFPYGQMQGSPMPLVQPQSFFEPSIQMPLIQKKNNNKNNKNLSLNKNKNEKDKNEEIEEDDKENDLAELIEDNIFNNLPNKKQADNIPQLINSFYFLNENIKNQNKEPKEVSAENNEENNNNGMAAFDLKNDNNKTKEKSKSKQKKINYLFNKNTLQVLENFDLTNEEKLLYIIDNFKNIKIDPLIIKVLEYRKNNRKNGNENSNTNNVVGNQNIYSFADNDKSRLALSQKNSLNNESNSAQASAFENNSYASPQPVKPIFPMDDKVLFKNLEKYKISLDILDRPSPVKINLEFPILNKLFIIWDFLITFKDTVFTEKVCDFEIDKNISTFYTNLLDKKNNYQNYKSILISLLLLCVKNIPYVIISPKSPRLFLLKSILDNLHSISYNIIYDSPLVVLKEIAECYLYNNSIEKNNLKILQNIYKEANNIENKDKFENNKKIYENEEEKDDNISKIDNNIKIHLLHIIIGLCFETIFIKDKIKNEYDNMNSLSYKKKDLDESLFDTEKRMKELNRMENFKTLPMEIENLEAKLNELTKPKEIKETKMDIEKENMEVIEDVKEKKEDENGNYNKANGTEDPQKKKEIAELETQIKRCKSILKENEELILRKKEINTKINEIIENIYNLKTLRKKYLGIDYQNNEYYYFVSVPNKIFTKNKKRGEWGYFENKEDIQNLINKLTEKGKNERKLKVFLKFIFSQMKEKEEKEKEKAKEAKESKEENINGEKVHDNNGIDIVNEEEIDRENKKDIKQEGIQIKIDKIQKNVTDDENKRTNNVVNINLGCPKKKFREKEQIDNIHILDDDEEEEIEEDKEQDDIEENEIEEENISKSKVKITNIKKDNEDKEKEKTSLSQSKKELFTFVISEDRLQLNVILMKIDEVFSEYLVQFNKQWESERNRDTWKKILTNNATDKNILTTLKMFNHKFKNPYKILSAEEEQELLIKEKTNKGNNFIFDVENGNKFIIYETNNLLMLSPKVKIWSKEMDLIDIDNYYINDLLINVYSREQLCYVVHFYEMAIFGLVHRREGKRKL